MKQKRKTDSWLNGFLPAFISETSGKKGLVAAPDLPQRRPICEASSNPFGCYPDHVDLLPQLLPSKTQGWPSHSHRADQASLRRQDRRSHATEPSLPLLVIDRELPLADLCKILFQLRNPNQRQRRMPGHAVVQKNGINFRFRQVGQDGLADGRTMR